MWTAITINKNNEQAYLLTRQCYFGASQRLRLNFCKAANLMRKYLVVIYKYAWSVLSIP